MSLSDLFCVERHREYFFGFGSKKKLNITFANEQEIMALIKTKKFQNVIDFAKK